MQYYSLARALKKQSFRAVRVQGKVSGGGNRFLLCGVVFSQRPVQHHQQDHLQLLSVPVVCVLRALGRWFAHHDVLLDDEVGQV
jgi:hypothetical protein